MLPTQKKLSTTLQQPLSVASLLGKFLVTVETNVPRYFKKYIRNLGYLGTGANGITWKEAIFYFIYRWVFKIYYLRERSEASTAIFELINRVENLTGKKVKSFKSDNAKEYNSRDFFRNKGILHKKSIADIHETNGG
jgi:hypothetical protein